MYISAQSKTIKELSYFFCQTHQQPKERAVFKSYAPGNLPRVSDFNWNFLESFVFPWFSVRSNLILINDDNHNDCWWFLGWKKPVVCCRSQSALLLFHNFPSIIWIWTTLFNCISTSEIRHDFVFLRIWDWICYCTETVFVQIWNWICYCTETVFLQIWDWICIVLSWVWSERNKRRYKCVTFLKWNYSTP